jgi:hypothetical protein
MLGLDTSHLIDFLLGNNPADTQVTTTSTAMAGPAAASAATTTSLIKGQNGAALGNNVIILGALEVGIKVHDRNSWNFERSTRIMVLTESKELPLIPSWK